MTITGYSRVHLSNAYRTAKTFPPGSRFGHPVTWKHHMLVAAIEHPSDRVALLRRAQSERLTIEAFTDLLNLEYPVKSARSLAVVAVPRDRTLRRVVCPKCRHVFDPRQAAKSR